MRESHFIGSLVLFILFNLRNVFDMRDAEYLFRSRRPTCLVPIKADRNVSINARKFNYFLVELLAYSLVYMSNINNHQNLALKLLNQYISEDPIIRKNMRA